MKEKVLVSVKTFSVDALGSLKEVYKNLSEKFKVEDISSIFLVKHMTENKEIHKLTRAKTYDGLIAAFLLETEGSPQETLSFIKKMEKQIVNSKEKDVKIRFLAQGASVQMTPELTLPHPDLHSAPEELIPAAEIYPHYLHPILKKELLDLSKHSKTKLMGQFYAQGKTLLDKNS